VQTLVSAIEPTAIIGLGAVFGLIVLSILLPLNDVMGSMGMLKTAVTLQFSGVKVRGYGLLPFPLPLLPEPPEPTKLPRSRGIPRPAR
jgi:hypothetical protein